MVNTASSLEDIVDGSEPKRLTLRVPEPLGEAVGATAVVHSLRKRYPDAILEIYTKAPVFFKFIDCIELKNLQDAKTEKFDVDLRGCFGDERRPMNIPPYKAMYVHFLEMAEEQLHTKLERPLPFIELSQEEIDWANDELRKYDKPSIWTGLKTASKNKNWPESNWQKVMEELDKEYNMLNIDKYDLRQCLSITKESKGGITLDTFILHGSKAVGAKNVLVLTGSSRAEVVTYPDQNVIYIQTDCPVQPCGMHGYGVGCRRGDEKLFVGHEETKCIYDDFRCMTDISPEYVVKRFNRMIKHSNGED